MEVATPIQFIISNLKNTRRLMWLCVVLLMTEGVENAQLKSQNSVARLRAVEEENDGSNPARITTLSYMYFSNSDYPIINLLRC